MKLTSKISRIAICISVLAIILSLISAIGILSTLFIIEIRIAVMT